MLPTGFNYWKRHMNEFFSSLANCKLRYFDLNAHIDNKAPCVFIHGIGCASSFEYPTVIAQPNFEKRRCILIDLLGSGYSDKPLNFGYRTTDNAQVVIELIRHLQLSSFYLYGHSMGGSIAIEVASKLSGDMTGLMVSECNLDMGGGMFSKHIASQSEEDFVNHGYQQLLSDTHTPWAGCLQNYAPCALFKNADSLVKGIRPSWRELLYQLNIPKTYIFGENSLPDEDYHVLMAHGVGVAIVENAGHSMSWENPIGLASVLNALMPN